MADTTITKQNTVWISEREYNERKLAGRLENNTVYNITKPIYSSLTTESIDEAPSVSTVVVRTTGGTIKAADPEEDEDVVTLSYFNNNGYRNRYIHHVTITGNRGEVLCITVHCNIEDPFTSIYGGDNSLAGVIQAIGEDASGWHDNCFMMATGFDVDYPIIGVYADDSNMLYYLISGVGGYVRDNPIDTWDGCIIHDVVQS